MSEDIHIINDQETIDLGDQPEEPIVETSPALGVRRRARELAFRVLFEAEQGNVPLAQAWLNACANLHTNPNPTESLNEKNLDEDETIESLKLNGEGMAFAHRLVLGFDEQHKAINETLEHVIEGWSFNQMSKTDLNVLRISSYELMFMDTPALAIIEVAVRMAKKYGGEESGRFVNGVLAKLKTRLKK